MTQIPQNTNEQDERRVLLSFPLIKSIVSSAESDNISSSEFFAIACEKSFQKLGRWLQKLKDHPLEQLFPSHRCGVLLQKFITMICILKLSIEHEWIEEDAKDVHDIQLQPIDICTLSSKQHAKKQEALTSLFTIKSISLGSDNHEDQLSWMRSCRQCNAAIYNRAWSLIDEAGDVCAQCYLYEVRRCELSQRYSVTMILDRYHFAINVLNRMISEYLPPDVEATLNFVSLPRNSRMVIDEFINADPRPSTGRNVLTIGYALNKRTFIALDLSVQNLVYCHYCRCKRKFNQVILCTDESHLRTCAAHGPKGSGKSSAFYCFRCFEAYFPSESVINALSKRDWKCFYCKSICTCSICVGEPHETADNTEHVNLDEPASKRLRTHTSSRDVRQSLPANLYNNTKNNNDIVNQEDHDYQRLFSIEQEKCRKLELELQKAEKTSEKIKKENSELELKLKESDERYKVLAEKTKRLETMQEQAENIVPSLKKIAKAIATQAIQLSNVLPSQNQEDEGGNNKGKRTK